MNKTKVKKVSASLVALFLAALLVLTTPVRAASVSQSVTAVSGGDSTITVTVTNGAGDLLDVDAIKADLTVTLTDSSETVTTLNVSDATVVVTGSYSYGYGYQIPTGGYDYGYGYGYGAAAEAVTITFTWSIALDDGDYTLESTLGASSQEEASNPLEFSVTPESTTSTTRSMIGSSAPARTSQVMTLDLSVIPEAANLRVGDSVSFTLNGESHSAKVVSMGIDYVIVEIASEPFRVTINVGDELDVDVDKDGEYDITIYLEKIENGQAFISFANYVPPEDRAEAIEQAKEALVAEPVVEEPTEEPAEVEPKTAMITGIITVVIIAVAVGVAAWYFWKKK